MKRLAVACLCVLAGVFCLSHHSEEEDGALRTVVELDRDKDGEVDLVAETAGRKSGVVLRTVRRRETTGIWSQTRSVFVANQQILTEEDADGDGVFEVMVVINPQARALESFVKDRDGKLSMAPPGANERHRKLFAAVDEFWTAASRTNENFSLPDSIMRTQRELQKLKDSP